MGLFDFIKKHQDLINDIVNSYDDVDEDEDIDDEQEPEDGIRNVHRINIKDFLYTGNQWCPDCRIKTKFIKDGQYYECPKCNYSISLEESEYGDGYPTYESTFEEPW